MAESIWFLCVLILVLYFKASQIFFKLFAVYCSDFFYFTTTVALHRHNSTIATIFVLSMVAIVCQDGDCTLEQTLSFLAGTRKFWTFQFSPRPSVSLEILYSGAMHDRPLACCASWFFPCSPLPKGWHAVLIFRAKTSDFIFFINNLVFLSIS